MPDTRPRSDQELAAELAELHKTIPDSPLEELSFEQLAALQRATARFSKWAERGRRVRPAETSG